MSFVFEIMKENIFELRTKVTCHPSIFISLILHKCIYVVMVLEEGNISY